MLLFLQQVARTTRELNDFLPMYVAPVAVATGRTEAEILRTTYYHLARKFNRAAHPQAISRFFATTVAETASVCPGCLRGGRGRSLLHNFTAVTGCTEHRCHLLDRCPHCTRSIPHFKAPFSVAHCNHCNFDFRAHTTPAFTPDYRTYRRINDLRYLLYPKQWELESERIIRTVGYMLSNNRQYYGLTSIEAATEIGIDLHRLEGIELAAIQSKGATFADFLAYVDFFDLSFQTVFERAIELLDRDPEIQRSTLAYERVVRAITDLEKADAIVSKAAIRRKARVARETVCKHDEIGSMVDEAVARYQHRQQIAKQQAEERLIADVREALHQLEVKGVRASNRKVCAVLEIPLHRLRASEIALSLVRQSRASW